MIAAVRPPASPARTPHTHTWAPVLGDLDWATIECTGCKKRLIWADGPMSSAINAEPPPYRWREDNGVEYVEPASPASAPEADLLAMALKALHECSAAVVLGTQDGLVSLDALGREIVRRQRIAGEAHAAILAGSPKEASPAASPDLLAMVAKQAEDEALWCQALTATEAYLQAALRRLHAAVEGERRSRA